MKYGQTLQQRSIPAWSHHNIDYDVIKLLIKDHTTPGSGKTVSIPGRPDEKLVAFENSLFEILADQLLRIDLFVRSKAGEVQRRLNHAKKQLTTLSTRPTTIVDRRVPVGRLERYGRLESDIERAGQEITALQRFTNAQRTAIRKLLKKYKKWTGSSRLEERLAYELLYDPASFTNLNLGPILDDFAATRDGIRARFAECVPSSPHGILPSSPGSTAVTDLQSALDSGSKVQFDTAISTVPLGEKGILASYFVHPDNVVELQLVLLQHAGYFAIRSRSNSISSPISTSPLTETPDGTIHKPDYFVLAADDLDRFAREQNALTVNERELKAGSLPQRAQYCARWTKDEEPIIIARGMNGMTRSAGIKRKHVLAFFDRDVAFTSKKDVDANGTLSELRRELKMNERVHSLFYVSRCRTRVSGINNNASGVVIATLDTALTIHDPKQASAGTTVRPTFPFAVLTVRQEGSATGALLTTLDHSHLVERVRGFSMEYHAAWQTCSSSKISPPLWLPMLSQDIRKLPPPALERKRSVAHGSSGTASATPGSFSNSSEPLVTDSTTAVDSTSPDKHTELDNPPMRAFRKKRRRGYTNDLPGAQQQQQRYWSEYEHPEDGGDEGDPYVIYIDPNERSTFDTFFDKLGSLLGRCRSSDEEALVDAARDDESSDDDESALPRMRTYGTLALNSTAPRTRSSAMDVESGRVRGREKARVAPPQITSLCLVASLVILVVAFLLAFTGKQKYATEIDFGVIFAVASSLLFAIVGFGAQLREQGVTWLPWLIALSMLVLDAVGCGWLLAWMLG